MIKSRNIHPEAGKWTEAVLIASSVTGAFAFLNPTANEILIEEIVINTTTAASGKTIFAGVSSSATATNATNELIDGQTLTTGQSIISGVKTTVAVGSYVVGTLNATDVTLVSYVYIKYKEMPF